jgi:phosphoribosylamine--glycine ligase
MRDGAAVGVVIASEGYPDAPLSGRRLDGADPSGPDDHGPILRFHAATQVRGGEYVSSGGRVATVVGLGDTLAEARERAYQGATAVRMAGAHYRTDVAERDVA